jgi:hypothetical protein
MRFFHSRRLFACTHTKCVLNPVNIATWHGDSKWLDNASDGAYVIGIPVLFSQSLGHMEIPKTIKHMHMNPDNICFRMFPSGRLMLWEMIPNH